MSESVVFAHLSDIHFHHELGGDVWDLDVALRNELERDLERVQAEVGPFRGLLVTGDIAFSGRADEYRAAEEWLRKVTSIVGCHEDDVWMVPGNHDVQRSTVTASTTIQEFHELLRSCRASDIDQNLYKYLVGDEAGGDAHLAPLADYVAFATRYECAIEPSRPFWSSLITIGDSSVTLELRGLTTALISDSQDNADGNRLVLGSIQATIPRHAGRIVMTLAHHPLSWLRDSDTIDDLLRNSARIQLWGHRHTQRTRVIDRNLHLFAGAVHPQRGELDWEPRYNVITLSVEDSEPLVRVRLDGRVWYKEETKFGPDFDSDGNRFQDFSLEYEPNPEKAPAEELLAVEPPVMQPTRNSRRALAFAFSSLPFQRRLAVASELGLLDPTTGAVKDQHLFEIVLSRAVEQNVLAGLWTAIQRERGVDVDDNPFEEPAGDDTADKT